LWSYIAACYVEAVHWPIRKITNSAGRKRRHADETDKPAAVEVALGHRRAIAFHEEGLLGPVADERAAAPFGEQEVLDHAPHARPQGFAVRLEHRPLRSLVDRVLDVGEVAAQLDVFPVGVGAHRAGAPEADAPAREGAKAIDALGVQHLLLALVDRCLQADGRAHQPLGGNCSGAAVSGSGTVIHG
jgi:hypothetical protein